MSLEEYFYDVLNPKLHKRFHGKYSLKLRKKLCLGYLSKDPGNFKIDFETIDEVDLGKWESRPYNQNRIYYIHKVSYEVYVKIAIVSPKLSIIDDICGMFDIKDISCRIAQIHLT